MRLLPQIHECVVGLIKVEHLVHEWPYLESEHSGQLFKQRSRPNEDATQCYRLADQRDRQVQHLSGVPLGDKPNSVYVSSVAYRLQRID